MANKARVTGVQEDVIFPFVTLWVTLRRMCVLRGVVRKRAGRPSFPRIGLGWLAWNCERLGSTVYSSILRSWAFSGQPAGGDVNTVFYFLSEIRGRGLPVRAWQIV